MNRELTMSSDFFLNEIDIENDGIKQREAKNINDVVYPQMLYYNLFMSHYEILFLMYSGGFEIDTIKEKLVTTINVLEKYLNCKDSKPFDFKKMDYYNKSLWLISLALLLKIEDKDFNKLVQLIGNEGEDELFESLVSKRIQGRKKANKLIFLKEYDLLLEATKEGGSSNSIQQFLLSWYKNMKKCYWHNNHKGNDGGGFFGYWCWEAAAVAVAFNIDDTLFRDSQYYPKDMADYSIALSNE